jgi:hypothetical protein
VSGDRDNAGRFRNGQTGNPNGRPKKARGVDAAVLNALAEKVTVTEQGRRTRKSKLDITAAQIANKGAGGDMRAAKMAFDQVRKSEQNAQDAAGRAPVMTQSDHEIVARVIARLTGIISNGAAALPDREEDQ